MNLVSEVVSRVENVLPLERPIGHHDAFLEPADVLAVKNCLWDSFDDSHSKDLERSISKYCGVNYACATASGTAALHVALLAAGVQPNEEVLVPTLTFTATANAVVYAGATPNFIDGSIAVNAYKLRRYLERTTETAPGKRGRLNSRTGRVISALIVVDLLGFSADWSKIEEVARQFGLVLIEDAAQALGAQLGGRKCGSFGAAAILSFNSNKIVTGNGGGMLLTNDEWIAAKAYQLINVGKNPHPWAMDYDVLGYNYRMPSIIASLIHSQFKRLSEILAKKKKLHEKYVAAFDDLKSVEVVGTNVPDSIPNHWLTTILVESKDREKVLEALHKVGIKARALFTPLHHFDRFKGCPSDSDLFPLRYADTTYFRAVCLPSGIGLV